MTGSNTTDTALALGGLQVLGCDLERSSQQFSIFMAFLPASLPNARDYGFDGVDVIDTYLNFLDRELTHESMENL